MDADAPSPVPLKILHVITGLSTGGAEMMLVKLLANLPADETRHVVVSLTGGGPLADRIAALGVPVVQLGMNRPGFARLPALAAGFLRLRRLIRAERPDLVQAWMYHANLVAGLAALGFRAPPVIWGIRQSDLDPKISKPATIRVAKLGGLLSRALSDTILCCSEVARVAHERIGYDPARMVVIPNGFDLGEFKPDAAARAALRRELNLPDAAPLVGLIARFDSQKDHRGFLAAAAQARRAVPDAHFLLCGGGVDAANRQLAGWIDDFDLGTRCRLLGARADMPAVTAALDIAVSSSAFGEGFPNVLGEAMACGVPCVATDVGDSRMIVGQAGRVVGPRDPAALADAIVDLLRLPADARAALGAEARARVAERFEIGVIARRYLALYRDTLAAKAAAATARA
ncbi:MAG: glycosyltransferase [Alphaproteobacteria bacterium]